MRILIALLLCASPSFALDRYVSPAGNDANPGTLLLPYKTLEKAITAAMPLDRIVLRGGTYALSAGAGLVSMVNVVPYLKEAVFFQVPGQAVLPLPANVMLWTDLAVPSSSDVRIILKPGGRLNNVKVTRRKTDTSRDILITINKSTVLVVE